MVNILFAKFPILEVLSRYLYWYLHPIRRIVKLAKFYNKKSTKNKSLNIAVLRDGLIRLGVSKGDLLIVHSSYEELNKLGFKASQIITCLLDLLGSSGTLVMPAYPSFSEGETSFWSKKKYPMMKYDVKKTPAWTGFLPNMLMRNPNSIRSEHPINSLVALGPLASDMMKGNLYSGSYACGSHSSWEFCLNHNAKVLSIGLRLYQCVTMMHVNEDLNPDMWPIDGWYENRDYSVKSHGTSAVYTVPSRKPKWSLHYCGRRFASDMSLNGITLTDFIDDVPIEILRSDDLLVFLRKKILDFPGYPFFYCS